MPCGWSGGAGKGPTLPGVFFSRAALSSRAAPHDRDRPLPEVRRPRYRPQRGHSIRRLRFRELPTTVQNFGARSIETHHVVPALHNRQAVRDLAVGSVAVCAKATLDISLRDEQPGQQKTDSTSTQRTPGNPAATPARLPMLARRAGFSITAGYGCSRCEASAAVPGTWTNSRNRSVPRCARPRSFDPRKTVCASTSDRLTETPKYRLRSRSTPGGLS